jgi:hypothetical protein
MMDWVMINPEQTSNNFSLWNKRKSGSKERANIHEDFKFFNFITLKLDDIRAGQSDYFASVAYVGNLHLTNQGVYIRLPDVDDMVMDALTSINKALGGIRNFLWGAGGRKITELIKALIRVKSDEVVNVQCFSSKEHFFNDVNTLAAELWPLFGVRPFPSVIC